MTDSGKIKVTVDKDLEELIPDFLEMTKTDIGAMQTALAAGDFETVRRLGHTLKGSGAGYGFTEVTALGAKIEQLAKSSAGDDIKPLIAELGNYLERVEVVYE
jgi:HPt (histidine-containing phosphotransfer) domain-containing protein